MVTKRRAKAQAAERKAAMERSRKRTPQVTRSRVLQRLPSGVHGMVLRDERLALSGYATPEQHLDGLRGFLRVCSMESGKNAIDPMVTKYPVELPDKCSRALAFDPQAEHVVVGDGECARVHRISTGKAACHLYHDSWVHAIAYSPDGTRLATGEEIGRVQIWETEGYRSLPQGATVTAGIVSQGHMTDPVVLEGHTGMVLCMVFLRDSSELATGSEDCTVRIWNMRTPETWHCARVLRGHSNAVRALAMSPSEHLLGSGSKDCTIRLWGCREGSVEVLRGHTSRVSDCRFAGTGRILASASKDKSLRLWDTASYRCLAVLLGHSHRVNSCLLNHHGTLVISGSEDHTVRVWDTTDLGLPLLPWRIERQIWIATQSKSDTAQPSGCSFAQLPSTVVMLILSYIREEVTEARQLCPESGTPNDLSTSCFQVDLGQNSSLDELVIEESLSAYTR
eukprot:TRINITY_DN4962_c0_g1_i1.p1 TRINITY_DN4962_c0_g1~~TRINITY_DN4962_c0_g1_i1.p1  ORF type:complete len:452 (-),score=50.44 TRINITY_DN4962_c0_g1_i1:281-1636(-)